MSEFEQMMAEINVPEEIATQISAAANSADLLILWKRLSAVTDEVFKDADTATGVCALAMLNAYIGEKLSENVKFGKSPEDPGETVHPNFCIMAIALLAVNTLKATNAANSANGDDQNG